MPDASDIVWIEFPGAVSTKRRPAVVLSSDEYHLARHDVIVAVVTSQIAKATGTTDHVLVDWQAAGLRVPSAFRSFLATLPLSAVISKIGRLSANDWQAIRDCVKRSLALS
jgi:mRNA interferase MazF